MDLTGIEPATRSLTGIIDYVGPHRINLCQKGIGHEVQPGSVSPNEGNPAASAQSLLKLWDGHGVTTRDSISLVR